MPTVVVGFVVPRVVVGFVVPTVVVGFVVPGVVVRLVVVGLVDVGVGFVVVGGSVKVMSNPIQWWI